MDQQRYLRMPFLWPEKTQSAALQTKTLSGFQVAAHCRNWVIAFDGKAISMRTRNFKHITSQSAMALLVLGLGGCAATISNNGL